MSKRVFIDITTGRWVKHGDPNAEPRRRHVAIRGERGICIAPAFSNGRECGGRLLRGSLRHYPSTYWEDTSDRSQW